MPPRGSRLQRAKSNSDQQINSNDQSHLSESNQKSDSENPVTNKQTAGTDSDETQQQIAVSIEIQKQQDALMTISQHNFIIPINDQEEKSKDFLEAKSKIQDIDFDKIKKMLKRDFDRNQDKIIQNLHKFHGDFNENDALQIFNILSFLTECLPFIKLCPFISQEKRESFASEIRKLLNFNENDEYYQNYFQNVSSFCSDFDNLFASQYNCKFFHIAFRQNFSKLTSIMSNSIQKISNRGKFGDFIDEYRKVNESLTSLYISYKILMKTQRIRTATSFVNKLISCKTDFNQFLFITDLMTDDLLITITDLFDFIIKFTLYLKTIFMIHQFIEIIDNNSAKIRKKQHNQLIDNEIINSMETPLESNSIGDAILDDFSFIINNKTDFLILANEFLNVLNKDIQIDDFKKLLFELMNKSFLTLNNSFHQCGLKPITFSLNYHYRMIQAATSSMILLLKTEPFGQVEYLRKVFVALNILLKKYSSLKGKDIELGIINDLSFTLIMQIKEAWREEKLKSSYKGTAAFQTVYKYIKLFIDDLETIESTICFAHQVDYYSKEFNITSDETSFNLNCQFYSPSEVNLSDGFDNSRGIINQNAESDNYNSIINELSFELHSHGYDILPQGYSQNTNCDILAPNISNAVRIMLNYGDYLQIQKIIEDPNQLSNEENLFALINDIYKKIIDTPQSALQLKEAICIYVDTYFLLKALSLAHKIDFCNAVHLMYFRTHASIIFKDDFIGRVSLVEPFEPTSHPCYHSILKRLVNYSGLKQINDEISHIRLYFFKFAENVFRLYPSIVAANIEPLSRIFEWFSNPFKESNKKFLTNKYFLQVKELRDTFTQSISGIRDIIKANKGKKNQNIKKLVKSMREIETILNSIIDIQIHYIQFQKIELLMPYLRSFFKCQEEDKRFCQFISYYPVWFNAVHRCSNYNLIKLDPNLLNSSFKSTQPTVVENCLNLINSFDVQYSHFFNELISCSAKTNDQTINMMVDLIVRGSFSFENIGKLFHYVLKYFISSTNETNTSNPEFRCLLNQSPLSMTKIIQQFNTPLNYDIWRNVVKLSCFLIALNIHSYLRKRLDINILRIINMKNFINSYINGFHYLHSSALSSSFDKESARQILLNFKDMQRIVSEMPINTKIHETYFVLNKIISIINSANRYLCEIGPEEGFIARIESFIRNIQDKKIRKAFKSSFKVALLSGTSSQGSTTLLSKSPTGTPVSAAQTVISNGYDSIFYNQNEENLLDDMNEEIEEYVQLDKEFLDFIKRNSENGGNSNYFGEEQDTCVNVASCALNKELISEIFNDEERRIENYVKVIDMINILSLYLTIVKEKSSFVRFATFDLSSYIRMNPPFVICKPPNWDRSAIIAKNSMLTVNLNSNSQQAAKINQNENVNGQIAIENEDQQQNENQNIKDWLNIDFYVFNNYQRKSANNVENNNNNNIEQQNQPQNQIIPLQYAFSDTGISSSKFRLKILYNNAQQSLKNPIPPPRPIGDITSDQPLPIEIQQLLVDQINDHQKGMKPEYIEDLKRQSLEEQKEIRRKMQDMHQSVDQQKDKEQTVPFEGLETSMPHLLKVYTKRKDKMIGEEEDKNEMETYISSLQERDDYADRYRPREEEEEKEDNDTTADDNEGSEFQEENEVENETKRGRGRGRGRGRAGRKRGSRNLRNKNTERTSSTPASTMTLHASSSSSSVLTSGSKVTQPVSAPATETLAYMNRLVAKLNQLESDEIKAYENREIISQNQPIINTTISIMEDQIRKGLPKATNDVTKEKNDYYNLMIKYTSDSANFALKSDQLKQSQNTSKGFSLSSTIAQKAVDGYSKINEINKTKVSNQQENIKLGYNLFNPFNLNFRFNNESEVTQNKQEHIPTPEENDNELRQEIEKQRHEGEMTPSELLLMHQNQIQNITQRQSNLIQQKAFNNYEISNQSLSGQTSFDKDIKASNQNELDEDRQTQAGLLNANDQNQQIQQNQELIEETKESAEYTSTLQPDDELFNQETPNYISLPTSLQKFTRPCFACLSKDELDQNMSSEDINMNQKLSHFIDTEKTDDFETVEKRSYKLTLNNLSDRLLNENPADLQQRFNVYKKRINSLVSLASEMNPGSEEKIKPSSSSGKKVTRASEKAKIEAEAAASGSGNDNQVLSEADAEMAGESEAGFGLDNDVAFGFESDSGSELF